MGIGRIDDLTLAIRRALTSVAIFAQVLLLFAPMIEVRDGDSQHRVLAAGVTTLGIATLSAERRPGPQHDATTCPACIAQTLHAQVAPAAPTPTCAVVEGQRFDAHSAVVVSTGPPTAHRCRAPPALS